MKRITRLFETAIITLVLILSITSLRAQHKPTLWGMKSSGDSESGGTLFKFDPELIQLDVKFEFESYPHGNRPGGRLVFIGNKAYGTTTGGGENNEGVIYVYDLDTEEKTTLHHFDNETGGIPGVAPLLVEGKLYGGTTEGGTNDAGVLYEFDPATDIYTVLHEFDDTNDGKSLVAGLAATDDVLYGITYEGGTNGLGTFFKYDLFNQSFTLLHTLAGTEGTNSSYALLGQEGLFYGVGLTSGENDGDEGRIFIYDTSEETFTSVSMELQPTGSLVPVNGKMYGTATSPFFQHDAIYEFDPTDNSYEGLRGIEEDDVISSPRNSFIELNGWLYGLGGQVLDAHLYRYKIETDELELLRAFDVTDGTSHESTLVLHNSFLYGAATSGGQYDGGTLIVYDPDDDKFNKLTDFEKNSGVSPNGPLVQVDGILYGTTTEGGEENNGVLFSYDPENEIYTFLLDFETIGGSEVHGPVIHDNGILYGTSGEGGLDGNGMVFQYDLNTHTADVVYDFSEGAGNAPANGLILDNNKLYGGTYSGGAASNGLIFEVDLSDNSMKVLHALENNPGEPEDGIDGMHIENGVLKIGNVLYGTAASGGLHDGGTLFAYDLTTEVFSVLHHFTDMTGTKPGQLIMVDGILYGTVNTGGTASSGGIFQFDPDLNQYTVLHHFGTGVDGLFPAPVLAYAEGQLYGIAPYGGATDHGILFQYTIESEVYGVILNMDANTGSNPAGGLLVQISNEAPEVTIGGPIEVCAGSEIPAYVFQAGDSDNDLLAFTVTSSNTTLVPNASLSVMEVTEGNYQLLVDLESIAAGETIITITTADGYGGEGSAELSISRLSLPTVGITASSEVICAGESVTLSATGGINYSWEGSVINGIAFEPESTATYSVMGEGETGCTASSSIEIVVNSLPTITINASSEAICADESVTLSATGGTNYSWGGSVVNGIAFEPESTATYTVMGEGETGCTASSSIEIVVNPLPAIAINATSEAICADESVTLSASGATTYDWGKGINDGVAFAPEATATYMVTGEDAQGCTSTTSMEIVVYDLPVINAENTTDPTSIDVSITEGLAPYVFDWDNDGVGDADDEEDLVNQPAGTYTLMVTDANGCTASSSFDIESILAIDGNTSLSESFQVYPNPVSKGFSLSVGDITEVLIYDLKGNLVKQYQSVERYYNIENLDNGVYLLSLKTTDQQVVRKIVKI
ncbi:MAG: choice-of-anchor tandem repeat GloVer-containing protein [Reichenbachiella sp.]|uniref:choice-of-anchor tandem repeat GloVer-containing protein n=2 Tax=Reichenbachiella sp. TaxID=2184521 RepID=UPI0032656196